MSCAAIPPVLHVSVSATEVKNAFIQWRCASTVHWSRLFDAALVCSVRDGTRHFHCTRKCGAVGRVIATAVPWCWIVCTLQCALAAAAAATLTHKICVCVSIRSQNQQLIFHYTTLKVVGFYNRDVVCLLRGTD